jgi:aryl-alcohol dehydrogenase-like predicted oxidoreductase
MEKRNIGSLQVTVAGLGCNNFGWRIDAAQTANVVDAAIDAGINFFDTADIYATGQSEEYLGQALGARRTQVIVATKFGLPMDEKRKGAKPAYVRQAVEDSLRRLGTDYIDLYQLHRPDESTPIADTLGVLDELVRAGKVREIGCSNFTRAQLLEAADAAKSGGARFVSVQNNYSLLHREPEPEVLPECVRQGLAFLPFFPLANGLLSGKYRAGATNPSGSRGADGWGPKVFTDANLAIVEKLIAYGEEHGDSLLDLAISWLTAQPAVASVIAGAKTPEQVRINAAAVSCKLSAEDLREINAIAPRTA